jgi:hypothetical protein
LRKRNANAATKRLAAFVPEEGWDTVCVPGYVGKAKGMKQELYDRGWWKKGMQMQKTDTELDKLRLQGKPLPEKEMVVQLVLSALPDYQQTKSALQELVENEYGYIVLVSPKCHPELAGVGVEYVWGYTKKGFRRDNLDQDGKQFVPLILKNLSDDYITLSLLRKFARRTRVYDNVYSDIDAGILGEEGMVYSELESTVKVYKSHRCIEEIEREFLNNIHG